MAKQLRHPSPSSSVARLLDLDAAARAVRSNAGHQPLQVTAHAPVLPEAGPSPAAIPAERTHERACQNREVVLTPSADETFSRLVELYRRATGTRLTSSHVVRAVLKGVSHCMDQLEREARRLGPLKLPSNARGRELERERFEARLADAFIAGVRASSAFASDEP